MAALLLVFSALSPAITNLGQLHWLLLSEQRRLRQFLLSAESALRNKS
jgi:hypothetical protein